MTKIDFLYNFYYSKFNLFRNENMTHNLIKIG